MESNVMELRVVPRLAKSFAETDVLIHPLRSAIMVSSTLIPNQTLAVPPACDPDVVMVSQILLAESNVIPDPKILLNVLVVPFDVEMVLSNWERIAIMESSTVTLPQMPAGPLANSLLVVITSSISMRNATVAKTMD